MSRWWENCTCKSSAKATLWEKTCLIRWSWLEKLSNLLHLLVSLFHQIIRSNGVGLYLIVEFQLFLHLIFVLLISIFYYLYLHNFCIVLIVLEIVFYVFDGLGIFADYLNIKEFILRIRDLYLIMSLLSYISLIIQALQLINTRTLINGLFSQACHYFMLLYFNKIIILLLFKNLHKILYNNFDKFIYFKTG